MPPVVNGFQIRVDLKDLQGKLEQLGQRMANNVVRRAILAGMGVVRTEARRLAPTPRLSKSARKKAQKNGKKKLNFRRAKAPPGGWPPGYWSTGALKRMISADTKTKGNTDGTTAQLFGRVFIRQPLKKGAFEALVGEIADGTADFKGRVGRNPRRYAHLVEFGVSPHSVGKGSVRVAKGKKLANAVGIKHPGHKARPFMRPAWDGKKEEAKKQIEIVARRELDKELKAIARGGKK
jgi:HK97 gp10 family phage protein